MPDSTTSDPSEYPNVKTYYDGRHVAQGIEAVGVSRCRGKCSCGWMSRIGRSSSAVAHDVRAHVVAENTRDAERDRFRAGVEALRDQFDGFNLFADAATANAAQLGAEEFANDVLALIDGGETRGGDDAAVLEGKVARMQPVVDVAVKLRGCRAALDHAASQGKSQDFMGQLRERYGWTGRELDRVVDEFGVLDGVMNDYLATRGGDDA